MSSLPPKIVTAFEGIRLNVLGVNVNIRLTGAETGGAYTLVEQSCMPGIGVPLHVHANEDETFFVVEGQVSLQVGDKAILGVPGTTVFLPRTIPHQFIAVGEKEAKMIVIISPSGLERMFQELGELPPGMPDMAKVTEICSRYRVSFLV